MKNPEAKQSVQHATEALDDAVHAFKGYHLVDAMGYLRTANKAMHSRMGMAVLSDDEDVPDYVEEAMENMDDAEAALNAEDDYSDFGPVDQVQAAKGKLEDARDLLEDGEA